MDALEEVEKELNEATRRAWTLVQSTDGRLFTVRPTPKRWSAAECIAHLSISSEQFLPVLRDAIAKGRRNGKRGPVTMDVLGRVLRWFLEPPIRTKVKTSAPFVPKSTRAKADAFGEFASLQDKLMDLVRDARDTDLRVKIVSPFDKRVRYNLLSAFRIVAAHERRHLWQAEQAVAELRRVQAASSR
ncbi:MAG TPA: DinB family protein [Thermoanaerobaculia bacterium]|nr:DinB family protein [Thermoanaerobaculia bacterium]